MNAVVLPVHSLARVDRCSTPHSQNLRSLIGTPDVFVFANTRALSARATAVPPRHRDRPGGAAVAALSKNHGPANFRDLNGTLAGQILYLAWPATCLRWQSSVEKVMKSLNKGAAMKTRRDTSGLCIALPLALSLGAAACRSQ